VVDFLTWFFALYPVWILGCGFLLWRSKEYRTNGDALVHTAVTGAAHMTCPVFGKKFYPANRGSLGSQGLPRRPNGPYDAK
jgi:hypothetical protein